MSLEVDQLGIRFGGIRVVTDVSFTIEDGARLALIGPNGAGKSSIINAICGVVRPHTGMIRLNGREITRLPTFRRARAGIGRTFQNLELFGAMSVAENLMVSLNSIALRRNRQAWQRGSEGDSLLKKIGLWEHRERAVDGLPYGLRKLVEVSRCLIRNPSVVLLDEPAAGLDTSEKVDFIERLDELLNASGATVLLVEHDMPVVERLCGSNVVVLDEGKIIAHGSFDSIVRDTRVMEAYLGIPRNDPEGKDSGVEPGSP